MSDLGKLCYSKVDGMSLCFSKKDGSLIYKGEKQVEPEPDPEPDPGPPQPIIISFLNVEPFIHYGNSKKLSFGNIEQNYYYYNKFTFFYVYSSILKINNTQYRLTTSSKVESKSYDYTEVYDRIDHKDPDASYQTINTYSSSISARTNQTITTKTSYLLPNAKLKFLNKMYSLKRIKEFVSSNPSTYPDEIVTDNKWEYHRTNTDYVYELHGMNGEKEYKELEPIGNGTVIHVKQGDKEITTTLNGVDIRYGDYLAFCIHLDKYGWISKIHTDIGKTQEEAEALINY